MTDSVIYTLTGTGVQENKIEKNARTEHVYESYLVVIQKKVFEIMMV